MQRSLCQQPNELRAPAFSKPGTATAAPAAGAQTVGSGKPAPAASSRTRLAAVLPVATWQAGGPGGVPAGTAAPPPGLWGVGRLHSLGLLSGRQQPAAPALSEP